MPRRGASFGFSGPFGAEAADSYTFKLTFQDPVVPEDFLLEKNREFYVLPTHRLEGVDPAELMDLDLWEAPVGSGPCKFVSETPGSQLVLEANPDYQLGAPGFDRLVITVIDKSNLLTSLIAGDLDYYAFGGNVSVEDAEVARAAGLEVLEEIRKKDPAAKVIMCSAMGQEQMITNALMLGASDFIVKPFKADEFMKVVEYTLSS